MPYTYTPLQDAQHIKLDLFPSNVALPHADVSEEFPFPTGDKRTIVTDSHLLIFTDGSENVTTLVEEPIISFEGSPAAGYMVEIADGTVYHVFRAASCGCGSRLRGFHPFPGTPYLRMRP